MARGARRVPGCTRLPDGRWKVRADGRDPRTGKRKSYERTLEADADEEELLRTRADLKALANSHAGPAARGRQAERTTVRSYSRSWAAARSDRVRPHVARNYARVLGKYVLPFFGDLFCDAVVRADVERWVAWAEQLRQPAVRDGKRGNRGRPGDPYAPETLKNWWRVCRMFLKDMAADFGTFDPTLRVRAPRAQGKPVRSQHTLTYEQLGLFLRHAAQIVPDRYAEIVTLALTGIRVSELYALRWQDIDFARRQLFILHSQVEGHVDETKTRAGREVAMAPVVAEALQAHRKTMMADPGHPGHQLDVVFPSARGTYRHQGSLTKPMRTARQAAALPMAVTPRVMRRTFNTLMIAAGVDRVVLRAQMGHSSEELTERYAGIPMERKREAVLGLADRAMRGEDE